MARNLLQVDEATEKHVRDEFFEAISNTVYTTKGVETMLIDFQKIVPVEPDEKLTYLEKRELYLEAWGTPWSCDVKRHDENTIEFQTKENGVPHLMLKLSEQHPHIKLRYVFEALLEETAEEHPYDEDFSIADIIIQGGIVLSQTYYLCGTEECEDYKTKIFGKMEILSEEECEDVLNRLKKIIDHQHELGEMVFDSFTVNNPNPLEITLDDLNLNVGAHHCLRNAKINTVADIVALSKRELGRFKHMGPMAFMEIIEKLEKLGLTLRDEPLQEL